MCIFLHPFRKLAKGVDKLVSLPASSELLRLAGRASSDASADRQRGGRVRHHPHHLQHGDQLRGRQGPLQVKITKSVGKASYAYRACSYRLCLVKCHSGNDYDFSLSNA